MIPTGTVIRRRIVLCMLVFLFLFFVLAARLFYLQVVEAESLQKRAQTQWTSEAVIRPRRGAILDRVGNTLAISATAYTVSVSPRQVKDVDALARVLAPILSADQSALAKKASDRTKGGVTLKRQLPREVAQELKLLMASYAAEGIDTLDGVYLEEESRRYYPYGAFATQLIGLTTIDGVGQAGLESALNNYLSGKSGRVVSEIDGKGRALTGAESEYIASVDGHTVYLTIDAAIQGFAEKAAREAMSVNNAQGVRIIVMNPQTGEILAMVSKPDYDPNDPPRNDVETLTDLMRNRALADAYEPGSTFKIITMSAVLEEKLTNLNEWFYCSGSVYVEGGRIKCWGNPHGAESLTEALQNSCNPVFVELGLRLGTETFYDYLDAFGFGRKTGVDIPGEGSGILIGRSTVKRVDIARIGFGQSVAATPLQLLNAACAVVNGGNLLTPYVVKEIVDKDGNQIEKGETEVRGHPISEATSQTMRTMLEQVVAKGGGRNAYISGYHVGGKTGTAQVYIDGVVSSDTHIGSFIGFAPMDDPQIAVLVIVDSADRYPDYGSVTAAPFARDILEQSLIYLGVAPDASAKETIQKVTVPDVKGMTLSNAMKTLKKANLQYQLSASGDTVYDQMPIAGQEVSERSIVMLYVASESEKDETNLTEVPDVIGMPVAEAGKALQSFGLQMVVSGGGVAVSQTPESGTVTDRWTEVGVVFAAPDS